MAWCRGRPVCLPCVLGTELLLAWRYANRAHTWVRPYGFYNHRSVVGLGAMVRSI